VLTACPSPGWGQRTSQWSIRSVAVPWSPGVRSWKAGRGSACMSRDSAGDIVPYARADRIRSIRGSPFALDRIRYIASGIAHGVKIRRDSATPAATTRPSAPSLRGLRPTDRRTPSRCVTQHVAPMPTWRCCQLAAAGRTGTCRPRKRTTSSASILPLFPVAPARRALDLIGRSTRGRFALVLAGAIAARASIHVSDNPAGTKKGRQVGRPRLVGESRELRALSARSESRPRGLTGVNSSVR
jgi:hypothetical protein